MPFMTTGKTIDKSQTIRTEGPEIPQGPWHFCDIYRAEAVNGVYHFNAELTEYGKEELFAKLYGAEEKNYEKRRHVYPFTISFETFWDMWCDAAESRLPITNFERMLTNLLREQPWWRVASNNLFGAVARQVADPFYADLKKMGIKVNLYG